MAEELLRSRHAFGTLEGVLSALTEGKIDHYDILFLKDANGKPYIGWIDKNNEPVILRNEEEVIPVDVLPESGETGKIYIFGSDGYFWNGTEFINLCKPTDVSVLEAELTKLRSEFEQIVTQVNEEIEEVNSKIESIDVSVSKIRYEVDSLPVGSLVDYREDEIRIMCPKDTVYTKQAVGAGRDPNSYYMTFKTYVPNDDAVGYIEHLGDQVDPEILTNLSTDKYGRKYQPSWLAVAKYDEASDTWSYYGANSTDEKYIGWDYQIDWYNADGVMIASDSIRINLSNEECHSSIEPYYIKNIHANIDEKLNAVSESAKTYTDEQIAGIMEAMAVVEF